MNITVIFKQEMNELETEKLMQFDISEKKFIIKILCSSTFRSFIESVTQTSFKKQKKNLKKQPQPDLETVQVQGWKDQISSGNTSKTYSQLRKRNVLRSPFKLKKPIKIL